MSQVNPPRLSLGAWLWVNGSGGGVEDIGNANSSELNPPIKVHPGPQAAHFFLGEPGGGLLFGHGLNNPYPLAFIRGGGLLLGGGC